MNTALSVIEARVAGESSVLAGIVTEKDLKSSRAIMIHDRVFRSVSARVFQLLTKNGVVVYCVFDKQYYGAQLFIASRVSDASSPVSYGRDQQVEFGYMDVIASTNDDLDDEDGLPRAKRDHQIDLSKLDRIGKSVVELADKLDAIVGSLPTTIELSSTLSLSRIPGKKVTGDFLLEYAKPGKASIEVELEPSIKTQQLGGGSYMNVAGAQLTIYINYPNAIDKNGQVVSVDDRESLDLSKQITLDSIVKLVKKMLSAKDVDISKAAESVFVYELDSDKQKTMVRDGSVFKKELAVLLSKYALSPVGKGKSRK